MSDCTHDCSTCTENCSSRKIEKEKQNEKSNVKKVIGIVSGKGGVGKSLITSLLAVAFNKAGKNTAILDADITGPSIPKTFGITEKAYSPDGVLIYPAVTENGIKIMSVNLLLEDETQPVVWRGPVIAGAVKQFYTDVIWGDVDYMFVDMPPGTGDVPLTVFQSLPLDGIIIVTSPQDLVTMIVDKAVKMAKLMNVPILALVENYSYIKCPDCDKKIEVFGKSKVEETAKQFGIELFAKLPIDNTLAKLVDGGKIEKTGTNYLQNIVENLIK